MTTPSTSANDDDALVAEYVVGVLPLDERRALEARITREPALRIRIEDWETRMAGLNEKYGELDVPAAVKTRIDRRLFDDPRPGKSPWAWLFGVASGILATAVAVAIYLGNPQNPDLRATLTGDQGDFVIALDAQGGSLDITLAEMRPPEGSVFELWAVRPDEAPISLGTFSSAGAVPLLIDLSNGETLAVSIEPAGGSPSGAPTGPVVAAGALQDV